jgi:hypothetical protein
MARPTASHARVAYLEGDPCSPKYIAGTLRAAGVDVSQGDGARATADAVFLVSDVAAADVGEETLRRIADAVASGAGLIAVGGWKSFGRGGWAGTPLEAALPVYVRKDDDRVNTPMGTFLRPRRHALVEGLPWDDAPVITGFNRVSPRPSTETVIEGVLVDAVTSTHARLLARPVPILVLGRHGRGRTAALATDLAPHWSGGWTDWGRRAVSVGEGEEVGDAYLEFLRRLVEWVRPGRRRRPRTGAETRPGRARAAAPDGRGKKRAQGRMRRSPPRE